MQKLDGHPGKLIAGFIVALLVVGAAGVLALLEFNSGAEAREVEVHDSLEDLMLAERLRADIEKTISSGRGFLLAGEPSLRERARSAEADVDRGIEDLQRRIENQEGRELLARLDSDIASYERSLNDLIEAKARGEDLEVIGRRFEQDLLPRRHDLDRTIDAFISHRQGRLAAAFHAEHQGDRLSLGIALGTLVLSIAFGGVVSVRSATRLSRMSASQREAVLVAERAVASRQQVLATVAHDLRGPLSTLSLKAAIIRKSADLERVHEQAESIGNIAVRMEYLVRSLLDAASLDSGGFAVTPADFDADDLVRDALQMFSALAAAKSIQIEGKLPPQPIPVHADRERSLQVLCNLLGNAIKFTPQGGRIAMSAEVHGEWVMFTVSDNGPGIAPEHIPHLFARFWRPRAGDTDGTGLGLFISQGIVEAHGGRIWVESQLGHGATFRFTLSKSAASQAPLPPAGEPR